MFKNIDWNKLIEQELKPEIRTVFNLKYLYVGLHQLRVMWINFEAQFETWWEKAHYTSEVNLLEKLLNQKFDPELEQIYLDDPEWIPWNNIFNKSEQINSLCLYNVSEAADPDYLYGEEETDSIMCIVWIPDSLNNSASINKIKAVMNCFITAGKTYSIQVIP